MITYAEEDSFDEHLGILFGIVMICTLAVLSFAIITNPIGLVYSVLWICFIIVFPLLTVGILNNAVNFFLGEFDNEFFFWGLYLIKFTRSYILDYAGA